MQDSILTFQLESEVIGQVAALVVAAEKEDSAGIADLQTPQIEDALKLT
jgi:hypothetical protein